VPFCNIIQTIGTDCCNLNWQTPTEARAPLACVQFLDLRGAGNHLVSLGWQKFIRQDCREWNLLSRYLGGKSCSGAKTALPAMGIKKALIGEMNA